MGQGPGKPFEQGRVVVYEDVSVAALFIDKSIVPQSLNLDGRWHNVTNILKRWSGSGGYTHLRYWVVQTDGRKFTLCYNAQECFWMAEAMKGDGHG